MSLSSTIRTWINGQFVNFNSMTHNRKWRAAEEAQRLAVLEELERIRTALES